MLGQHLVALASEAQERAHHLQHRLQQKRQVKKQLHSDLRVWRFWLKDLVPEETLLSERLIMQVIKLQILKTSHRYHIMVADHLRREESNGKIYWLKMQTYETRRH